MGCKRISSHIVLSRISGACSNFISTSNSEVTLVNVIRQSLILVVVIYNETVAVTAWTFAETSRYISMELDAAVAAMYENYSRGLQQLEADIKLNI